MNASPGPPTGAWRLLLIALAIVGTGLRQLGKPGAALERWAMIKLGVWSDEGEVSPPD
jgi:hypothetical protein